MSESLFQEVNFHQHEPLIKSLDAVIEAINFERSNVDKRQYKHNMVREVALSRVSEAGLEEIETYFGNRHHATFDCNILRFDNYNCDFVRGVAFHYLKEEVLPDATKIGMSGRTWYPPEFGYMGWHTNSDHRCYRLYCSYCREADKSFFRYRDPSTKEIITSWDKAGWNFRLFKITDPPLWHCVYSETDRLSLGFSIRTPNTEDK